ncbi:MAG: hypothetical protein ACI9UK_001687, partial [Candidatus Krumholzibacteriia bacterium]
MWVVMGLALVCGFLVWPEKWGRQIKRGRNGNSPLFVGTGAHWRRNYGRRSFFRLGGATVLAGILAYSGADELAENHHAQKLRSHRTDAVAEVVKFFGERFWVTTWFILAAFDAWWQSGPLTRWARSNFEAMVVGLPTLWILQRGLGANRPSSDEGNPRWRPMAAANSASGHTFLAAVPWLNLAARCGHRPTAVISRVASWATGWSRLNDRKHYLSQIVLGWTIAWNAVVA